MDRALLMAQIEYSLDIQSTYFVLHTAKYYRSETFIRNCREVQDLGHEVGLHNNILTVAMKTKHRPRTILERELQYLRKNGVKIFGTAAHGDRACREFTYVNYEIFRDCTPPYREERQEFRGIKLHSLRLDSYGLYEAYFLPRDHYITDGSGIWRCLRGTDDEWHPDFVKHALRPTNVLRFLKRLSRNKGILQLLIHAHRKSVNIRYKR